MLLSNNFQFDFPKVTFCGHVFLSKRHFKNFKIFTAFNIEDIKLHEANNFGAQISNARVKMEDVEVACV